MKLKYIKLFEEFKEFLNEDEEPLKPASEITEDDIARAAEEVKAAVGWIHKNQPLYSYYLQDVNVYLKVLEYPTACTDGENIFFDPRFVNRIFFKGIRFVLMHEILHIYLQHMYRRGNRNPELYNEAADYALNDLLVLSKEGHPPTPRALNDKGIWVMDSCLWDPKYRGLNADVIYDMLQQEGKGQPQSGSGGGQGQPGQGQPGQGQPGQGQPGSGSGSGTPGIGADLQQKDSGGQEWHISGPNPSKREEGKEQGDQEGEGQSEGEGGDQPGGKANDTTKTKEGDASQGEGSLSNDFGTDKLDTITRTGAAKSKFGKTGKGAWGNTPKKTDRVRRFKEGFEKHKHTLTPEERAAYGRIIKGDSVVDWKKVLEDFIVSSIQQDSLRFPSRRFAADGLYITTPQNNETPAVEHIVIGIDVSGSVGIEQMKLFINEVVHLTEAYDVDKVTILYIDTEVISKDEYSPFEGEKPDFSKIKEGGGTAFEPLFDYLSDNNLRPDMTLYLTDGEASHPDPRNIPSDIKQSMLWLIAYHGAIPGEHLYPPFGKNIMIASKDFH